VYSDVKEWLANVRTKGALFEEITKRQGWEELFGITDSRGHHRGDSAAILRQKILQMPREELARVLIYLDTKAGHKHTEDLDDDLEISGVTLNRSRDMWFWREASAREMRAQLNLRDRSKIGDWAFKSREQLLDIIEDKIRKGQW
jgi:hypothetical protein